MNKIISHPKTYRYSHSSGKIKKRGRPKKLKTYIREMYKEMNDYINNPNKTGFKDSMMIHVEQFKKRLDEEPESEMLKTEFLRVEFKKVEGAIKKFL